MIIPTASPTVGVRLKVQEIENRGLQRKRLQTSSISGFDIRTDSDQGPAPGHDGRRLPWNWHWRFGSVNSVDLPTMSPRSEPAFVLDVG